MIIFDERGAFIARWYEMSPLKSGIKVSFLKNVFEFFISLQNLGISWL